MIRPLLDFPLGSIRVSHASSSTAGSFRDLLLRYRGRCGLTQRQLAERLSIHRRSIQEWENGTSYPSTERLEGLIRALLQAHGLTPDVEAVEA
ncbi:MAG: helix-turn-helix transcriptional regulator, partial [Chloroflexi bacterium]|nr:helix-turn-helix transcriptional regulator [Chloroflexota bacterium]